MTTDVDAQREHAWRQVLRLDPNNAAARTALHLAPDMWLNIPDPAPHYQPAPTTAAESLLIGSGLMTGLGNLFLFLAMLIRQGKLPQMLLVLHLQPALVGAITSALLLVASAFIGLWFSWPVAHQVYGPALKPGDYGRAFAVPVAQALSLSVLGCLALGLGVLCLPEPIIPAISLGVLALYLIAFLPVWVWMRRTLIDMYQVRHAAGLPGLLAIFVTLGLWLIILTLLP